MSQETPTVRAQTEPTTARIGDVVRLKIEIQHAPGIQIDLPEFQKSLGDFEVRTSSALPTEEVNGQTFHRFEAELQGFTTGQLTIPGITVSFHDPAQSNKPLTLKTPALPITIQDVPAGPNDKGDIRGIKNVIGPVAWSPWWWLLLVGVALAVVIWAWSRRRKKIAGPPPPPPEPADVIALRALEKLRMSLWLEEGRFKDFYSALSDTTRLYLEQGFHIPALERTTSELLRDLRKHPALGATASAEFQMLYSDCDLVKFAKFVPEKDEALKAFEMAKAIIEKTRPTLPSGGA